MAVSSLSTMFRTANDPHSTVRPCSPSATQSLPPPEGQRVTPSAFMRGSNDQARPAEMALRGLTDAIEPLLKREKVRVGVSDEVPAFCTMSRLVGPTPSALGTTRGRYADTRPRQAGPVERVRLAVLEPSKLVKLAVTLAVEVPRFWITMVVSHPSTAFAT